MIYLVIPFGDDNTPLIEEMELAKDVQKMISPFKSHIVSDERVVWMINTELLKRIPL